MNAISLAFNHKVFVIHKKKKYRDVLKHPCHVDNVSRVRRNIFSFMACKKIQGILCRYCLKKDSKDAMQILLAESLCRICSQKYVDFFLQKNLRDSMELLLAEFT